ncbi:MAG: hypothetical protein U0840_25335 [Gemmataceae bacterium]
MKAVRYLGTYRDVTERKEAEEELRQADRKMEVSLRYWPMS